MFGVFKRFKVAKAAQKELTEAFKRRGQNFMTMENSVHEALVKEAMVTGVEATMDHFTRIEGMCFGRANEIIEHYKERSKNFSI